MNVIRTYFCILFLLLGSINAYSQVVNLGDELLVNKIKESDKKYKVIYIFCDYCQPSIERLPQLLDLVNKNSDSIDLFPVCAQDSAEVAAYIEKYQAVIPFFLINQDRKRKRISFYNPIKATCKYIERNFKIPIDKMGASDFCILDKDNMPLVQTNWEMKDEEYFNILKRFIGSNAQ